MPVRSIKLVLWLFFFTLPTILFAQQKGSILQKKEDTLVLKKKTSEKRDTVMTHFDSLARRFNPRKAVLRSAIVPGWGQWYNKKYWKIPIVYGALGTTAGVFFYNLKTYRLLRQAVKYLSDTIPSNDHLIAPELQDLPVDFLRENRNVFRQNIDYSVLVFLLFWGLNVVDAAVDAHLKAFDVTPDISMRLQPALNNYTNSAGISLVFFFKDKHSRPLLPLP